MSPDQKTGKDEPNNATEYVQDMYLYFRQEETAFLPALRPKISALKRFALVNWLMEIHAEQQLSPETLYLTVGILDRYLATDCVETKELEMVGLTSLFIASKYEETYYPSLRDLGLHRRKEDVVRTETKILKALNYQISKPTSHVFLIRYLRAAHADKRATQIASYLMEGALLSFDLLKYKPSQLAAASVFLARHRNPSFRTPCSTTLSKYSSRSEEDVIPVARAILSEKSKWTALWAEYTPNPIFVDKKFTHSYYGGVADMAFRLDF